MSQELIQDFSKSPTTTSGSTGQTCVKTGTYKATDGKIEFIVYYAAGDIFRNFPGGNRNKKCTWTKLSVASDGGRNSFTAVKVAPGTA